MTTKEIKERIEQNNNYLRKWDDKIEYIAVISSEVSEPMVRVFYGKTTIIHKMTNDNEVIATIIDHPAKHEYWDGNTFKGLIPISDDEYHKAIGTIGIMKYAISGCISIAKENH